MKYQACNGRKYNARKIIKYKKKKKEILFQVKPTTFD